MTIIKGNSRGNRLSGTDGGDVVFGLGGADRLSGGAGDDVLFGDDDRLDGTFGSGADRLDGGAGRDVLVGGAGADRLTGGDGDDVLFGGFATNVTNDGPAFGYAYSPALDGGDDSYDGGAGFDTAFVSLLRDDGVTLNISTPALRAITVGGTRIGSTRGIEAVTVYLGAGDDTVTGGASYDELRGGAGDDVLSGGGGADRIDGGTGNDRLSGGDGFDTVSYQDASAGVLVDFRLFGQAQDTRGGGSDTIFGFEQVEGSNFSDRITGAGGNDFITSGSGGSDTLSGGAGDDFLSLYHLRADTAATSTVNGDNGDDTLIAGAAAGASDTITVLGGSGADLAYLTAGGGLLRVDLGAGEDRVVLTPGEGAATITLGRGVDTIAFTVGASLPEDQIAAHVLDFDAGNNGDRIDLRDLLAGATTGYSTGDNPFAGGFVRLTETETGSALELDRDGTAGPRGFETLLELDGTQPEDFTAFNFGGTDPQAEGFSEFRTADHHWPAPVHLI